MGLLDDCAVLDMSTSLWLGLEINPYLISDLPFPVQTTLKNSRQASK